MLGTRVGGNVAGIFWRNAATAGGLCLCGWHYPALYPGVGDRLEGGCREVLAQPLPVWGPTSFARGSTGEKIPEA